MERTWAEINLDTLKSNIENIRKITDPKAKIMAVVKADAYGHGYLECCRTLLDGGADSFAVATVSEAKQLRRHGITVPILILGVTFPSDAEEIVKNEIMATVCSIDYAKCLSQAAQKLQKSVKIHIKTDTGMSRLGFLTGDNEEKTVEEILEISRLPFIEVDGLFSHFACADEKNREYTDLQFARFTSLINKLEEKGLKIPCKHIANSAAIMMYPKTHLDMVRAGVVLYGYYPSEDVDKSRLSLKPVMTLKSRITHIKDVEDGVGVSYGKTYITDKKTRIATIPVGYADGYARCLSQKAKIEVGGQLCNIIGRICMDQCMIDVTNVNNINVGDEVILFGDEQISADDIAKMMDTINYEVLCLVSKRIPRIYKEKGREVTLLDYLDKI